MKISVTVTREFETTESSDRLAFARHLANQGVRNVAPNADMRAEIQTGEDGKPVLDAEGKPVILQTPYCVLRNLDNNQILSETPFSSPEISDAMRFYGEMPGYLARVWVSRENRDNDKDADGNPKPKGNGKRGRKSNAERQRIAAEEAAKASGEGVTAPQTAEEILKAAQAAQNANGNGADKKEKATAGKK